MPSTKNSKRPSLNSSEFNIREIAKQMLLLEDHLTDDEKYCFDCIRKHLLLIEAYSEESLTLEPMGEWSDESKRLARDARRWMVKLGDGGDKSIVAKEIRRIRKQLVAEVHDPRGS